MDNLKMREIEILLNQLCASAFDGKYLNDEWPPKKYVIIEREAWDNIFIKIRELLENKGNNVFRHSELRK